MTTIAWDRRTRTLAADSQCTTNGLRCKAVKIVKSPGGFLAAGTGELNGILPWIRWVQRGLIPEEQPEHLSSKCTVIIVDPRGRAYTLEGAPVRVPLLDKFWAFGSGAELALGAMAMGADARTAVEVASKFDVYTGGRVVVLKPGVK